MMTSAGASWTIPTSDAKGPPLEVIVYAQQDLDPSTYEQGQGGIFAARGQSSYTIFAGNG